MRKSILALTVRAPLIPERRREMSIVSRGRGPRSRPVKFAAVMGQSILPAYVNVMAVLLEGRARPLLDTFSPCPQVFFWLNAVFSERFESLILSGA